MRRWTTAVLAFLTVFVLACEEGGDSGGPAPDPPASPKGGIPSSMAALGDSITAGFGSCLSLSTCTRNSWSTGDGLRIDSHYRRLVDANPALRRNAHNLARAGARASALPDQAAGAVRHKAQYVTVLIGANDACRNAIDEMTSPADFRADIDQALATLKKGLPKARVLVVSIPDLYRLWEIGHRDERVVETWDFGICPALLANPTSTTAADADRRARFRDRIDAYNDHLAAACRKYGSRCRHDGGAAHRVRFSLDMVTQLDHFHPNVSGLNKLADVTWDASGYARAVG
ncbi:GDSL-type esterase/lipase family protein [Solwaraspora sp. WMMD1047]|uniref:GDSL-type esterase/lipase family protein n=1 Tax=Solwaraspora sp. WMMD1047 TaxID=3016102 RepID=UPI002415DA47|nr:SGNH/GDSL hydrolase family protein [Solwaraspora sp. WMMD1047]MDG4831403.1 GDSL-type esterase/lipase family protein [Solwaraspora sp. WMMD1047]